MRTIKLAVVVLALAGIGAAAEAPQSAPPAGFKRTVLQQRDLSVGGREAVTAIAEFQPGATVGRHTHPGEEIGYVMEGTLLFEMAGKPNVTLKAGETFFVPPGTIHNATNNGSATATTTGAASPKNPNPKKSTSQNPIPKSPIPKNPIDPAKGSASTRPPGNGSAKKCTDPYGTSQSC